MTHPRSPFRAAVLIAGLGSLALAQGAPAATVTLTPGADEAGARVEIREQAPETNTMTITYGFEAGSASITVRDTGAAPVAGSGCAPVDAQTVRCAAADIEDTEAFLGALADSASTALSGAASAASIFVHGGDGTDTLTSATGAYLYGDAGNDTLTGTAGNDTFDGGTGDDTLDTGDGNDYLDGGPGNDTLRAGAGNDNLYAGASVDDAVGAGTDDLDGGPGNDTLSDEDTTSKVAEVNADRIVGGTGVDSVLYSLRTDDLRVDLSDGAGDGESGEGDVLVNLEIVYGGSGDDILVGDGDDNVISGGEGEDVIRGRGGSDRLDHYGLDSTSGDRGADEILSAVDSVGDLACGSGRDRIRQNRIVGSTRQFAGPRVGRDCERISRSGTVLDPVPVAQRANALTFRFTRFRCCKRILRTTGANNPFPIVDSERVTQPRETVTGNARTVRVTVAGMVWRIRR